MLDTLNKLSHDAPLELIDTYLSTNTKNEPKIIESPYEYFNSLKTTLKYSNLYSNAAFKERQDFLSPTQRIKANGKYNLAINQNSDEIEYVRTKTIQFIEI